MKNLPGFAGALLKIFATHILLFALIRATFMVANTILHAQPGVTAALVIQSFWMGFRFDANVLAFALALPCVLLFLHETFGIKILDRIAAVMLYIALPLTLFASCADIPYYIQFQKHLSSAAFTWFEHGTTSLRLIFSDFAYWGYLLLFLPLAYASVRTTKIFLRKIPKQPATIAVSSATFILVVGLLIIGIRGRLGKTAIHPGIAYTSEVMLTNQAALNPTFTLAYSYLFPVQEKGLFDPANDLVNFEKAKRSLGITGSEFVRAVKQADTLRPLNVVVVLMESMSSFKTGCFHQKVLTPNLVALEKQSLWFSNFYSSGIHTYSGIFSTVTGYPSILHEHALENYVYKKFNGLPANLKHRGYQTMFFVPHDEQFDNMGGFLTFNGIDQVYSDKDLPSSASLGPMGVPDHKMFDYAVEKLNTCKQPFFSLILTASDHGPWEIPNDIDWKPDAKDEQERATQYADWSIAHFMENARKQKWFDNTLFVFLGDHGSNHGKSYHMDIAFNQVPCIFYCPKYIQPAEYGSPALQIDVFPTIMGFLGYEYANHSMGVDLLKQKRQYAFFSQDDRVGCLNDDQYYFNLLFWGGKEYLVDYKELKETNHVDEKRASADSLRNYLITMLQAANYIIVNQKY